MVPVATPSCFWCWSTKDYWQCRLIKTLSNQRTVANSTQLVLSHRPPVLHCQQSKRAVLLLSCWFSSSCYFSSTRMLSEESGIFNSISIFRSLSNKKNLSEYQTNIAIRLQLSNQKHWTSDILIYIGLIKIYRTRNGWLLLSFCVFLELEITLPTTE